MAWPEVSGFVVDWLCAPAARPKPIRKMDNAFIRGPASILCRLRCCSTMRFSFWTCNRCLGGLRSHPTQDREVRPFA